MFEGSAELRIDLSPAIVCVRGRSEERKKVGQGRLREGREIKALSLDDAVMDMDAEVREAGALQEVDLVIERGSSIVSLQQRIEGSLL